MELENYIRNVPDFPKPGIQFKDITPLLGNAESLKYTIDSIVDMYKSSNVDKVGAMDARGFLFGTAVAYQLNVPFFPIRKAGKLPYDTIRQEYGLEYGKDAVEVHTDAVKKGERVLLLDDLLATGGTMKAGCDLVERLGGKVVACGFVIELEGLGGREKLADYDVKALLKYKA